MVRLMIGEQVEELAVKTRVVPLGVTFVCYAIVTKSFLKIVTKVMKFLMIDKTINVSAQDLIKKQQQNQP